MPKFAQAAHLPNNIITWAFGHDGQNSKSLYLQYDINTKNMITKPTTLILGAGASHDYGYPLGKGLKNDILRLSNISVTSEHELNKIKDRGAIRDGDKVVEGREYDMQRFLINNCQFDYDYIKKFSIDFSNSPKTSIDTFLENRPEFLELGKILIAISIMQKEHDNNFANKSHTWYYHLFNTISSSWESFDKNRLSIITYNYDRSLEYFLVKSLMATYGKSYEDCIEKVEKIPIIHVHGKVGGYAWGVGARLYDNHGFAPSSIRDAANSLNIITEGINNEVYDKVRDVISASEVKYVLGFGFDDRNMTNIDFGQYADYFYATRYGLSDLQLLEIRDKSKGKIIFSGSEQNTIMDFFKYEATLTGNNSGTTIAGLHNLRVLM